MRGYILPSSNFDLTSKDSKIQRHLKYTFYWLQYWSVFSQLRGGTGFYKTNL